MRLLILVCFITLTSSLSFVSMAQDKAAQNQPSDAKPSEAGASEKHPIEDTGRPSGEDRSEKVEVEDDSFDIDSFFQQGEDNAKNGHGCEILPEPIS